MKLVLLVLLVQVVFIMKKDIYSFLTINELDPKPIYQQLIAGMEKYCSAAGKKASIPPERILSGKLAVSRTILRKALHHCVEKGLLVKRWGKGYVPVRDQQAGRILVLCSNNPDISSPQHYILPGIQQRATELGIELETILTGFIYDRSEEFVTELLEKGNYTGILNLTYVGGFEEPAMKALRKTRIPLYYPYVAEGWAKKQYFHCGCVNTKQMFYDALKILADGGSSRIITITVEKDGLFQLLGIRGYQEDELLSLQESLGMEADPERILYCKYDREAIYKALDELLAKRKDFDSVLCISDFFAIHVISYLKAHNYRIPEDVAVMGFCGFPGGQFLDPALSTMDYQYSSIGYNAVDRLLEIASKKYRKLPLGGVIDWIDYVPCIRKSTRDPQKQVKKASA